MNLDSHKFHVLTQIRGGGIGWTGATTCVSGYFCQVGNPYYSQCVPGVATTPASVKTTSATSTVKPVSTTTVKVTTTSSLVTSVKTTTATGTTTTAVVAAGNPFASVSLYANPYYASEISAYAVPSLTGAMATKAAAVAKVPTFFWLDTLSKVPLMATYLANIQALNAAGASPPLAGTFVVYDLPDRDCAAAASNGEYSIANGGVANYLAYINAIKAVLVQYSSVKTILVVGKCL